MILIGENIHIISQAVRTAITERDEKFIIDLIKTQSNMDFIDLNIGPGKMAGSLVWLAKLTELNSKQGISFDTTNAGEMTQVLASVKNPENCFINSTGRDEPRLETMTELAAQYSCRLVALTLSSETGIPKTPDGRLDIAFEIYEKCMEKGIEGSKIFFDPLTLPVSADQTQAPEVLNTIRIIKESFDPPVNTVIGLSNISNGSPKELRPLINRVFGVLAYGAGLDAAIVDAKDHETVRILKMLDSKIPAGKQDELYIRLAETIENFSDVDETEFDKSDEEQYRIIKTARILMNKEVYSHSLISVDIS
ncbi:MAG: dihydropteroate synthase [Heliobacteriaceae bacterium]|jgi:cobalamin-dependent methionine synthase I|nr:dihydropteroate synthase [Heliobacteriaceae bacterium]